MNLVAQLFPQIMGETSALVAAAAKRRAGPAARRADRLVDRENDVGDAGRIAVMREGQVAGFLSRGEFSEENVMRLAVGRRDMQEAAPC